MFYDTFFKKFLLLYGCHYKKGGYPYNRATASIADKNLIEYVITDHKTGSA